MTKREAELAILATIRELEKTHIVKSIILDTAFVDGRTTVDNVSLYAQTRI